MLKQILVIVNIISFVIFIYGLFIHFTEMEPNTCEMTYMFQVPQFKKIHVTNIKLLSNYGLYYYTEGNTMIDIQSLNGAPVVFVPGNGGSYKQVRSLASVALRMGMKFRNKVHLDYFTIDYDEELSAFFGGYLEKQKQFLQISIRTIENLYRKNLDESFKIVIIAHSMGGIVAQSILCDEHLAKHIEGILFLSTPLHRPVVNFDSMMNQFYKNLNNTLHEKRTTQNAVDGIYKEGDISMRKDTKNEVLLVSIGGGARDLQVPVWLTTSPFIDVHVMTSAIPNVWLSCDHLSIVWCLQLMKVINKFLFSIVQRQPNNYVVFRQDFEYNFLSAYKHFAGSFFRPSQIHEFDYHDNAQNNDFWHLEESRMYHKIFKRGLQKSYNELIPLQDHGNGDMVYIRISQSEVTDWLYGCIAVEIQTKACKKIISMANYISWIPSGKSKKSYALLDVRAIIKAHIDWTHILVKLPTTKKAVSLQYDIFNSTERYVRFKAPSWLNFTRESTIFTSKQKAAFVRLIIENVNIAYIAIQLYIKKIDCSSEQADFTIKTRASWAEGFDEYHALHAHEQEKHIIVNPPIDSSSNINASPNHVYVEIHKDPSCRFIISQKISFQHTMMRIMQRFYTNVPAHLTAVLIIVLAKQFSQTEISDINIFKNALMGAFQFDSMLIAMACYLFQYYYRNAAMPNTLYELLITLLLQGTALIASILISLSISILLTFWARLLMIIMPRLSSISQFVPSSYMSTMISSWLTVGIVILSITMVTCCSMGLLLTCLVYFLWLSNIYKELLLKQVEVSKLSESEEMHLSIRNQYNKMFLHLKLLQLLVLLTSRNVGEMIAWVIKYPRSSRILSLNSQSISNIILLISWTLLFEMVDLVDFYNYKTVSLLLYSMAVTCILCCQENVFILNYIVSSVYISLLLLCSYFKFKKCWKHKNTEN